MVGVGGVFLRNFDRCLLDYEESSQNAVLICKQMTPEGQQSGYV